MFGTIVCGVDGAEGGRDAAALARSLAEVTGGRVLLAHAFPYDSRLSRPSDHPLEEDLRRRAEEVVAETRDGAGLGGARIVVAGDLHPARALHELAAHEEAGLIVVGSAHRGALGRVLLGDTAASTLHASPCAVAVAPRGHATHRGPIVTVGVGYVPTDEAARAVDLAAGFARAAHAKLRVLTVVTSPPRFPVGYPSPYAGLLDPAEYVDTLRRDARRDLDGVVGRVGGDTDGEVLEGRAVDALEAASSELDLLVLGSRDYGPVRRVLAGSVARHLAHHARCPLVVLPREAEVGVPGA